MGRGWFLVELDDLLLSLGGCLNRLSLLGTRGVCLLRNERPSYHTVNSLATFIFIV